MARIFSKSKNMRAERGAALVEASIVFAILAPVLLLGTFEISQLVFASLELSNAAHAGAAYAAEYYSTATTPELPTQAEVQTAADDDAPELLKMLGAGVTTLTVTIGTGCGAGAATSGNSIPSCSTGDLPYVQVQTQATVSTISFLPSVSHTLSSTATLNLVD